MDDEFKSKLQKSLYDDKGQITASGMFVLLAVCFQVVGYLLQETARGRVQQLPSDDGE